MFGSLPTHCDTAARFPAAWRACAGNRTRRRLSAGGLRVARYAARLGFEMWERPSTASWVRLSARWWWSRRRRSVSPATSAYRVGTFGKHFDVVVGDHCVIAPELLAERDVGLAGDTHNLDSAAAMGKTCECRSRFCSTRRRSAVGVHRTTRWRRRMLRTQSWS